MHYIYICVRILMRKTTGTVQGVNFFKIIMTVQLYRTSTVAYAVTYNREISMRENTTIFWKITSG